MRLFDFVGRGGDEKLISSGLLGGTWSSFFFVHSRYTSDTGVAVCPHRRTYTKAKRIGQIEYVIL